MQQCKRVHKCEQHERMHVHALCVSCKEITTRHHCNRSRVTWARQVKDDKFSKDYSKLESFIHD